MQVSIKFKNNFRYWYIYKKKEKQKHVEKSQRGIK